ncbi:MAG: hypothetical protein V4469_04405 [Patescibacteria group bacterium]
MKRNQLISIVIILIAVIIAFGMVKRSEPLQTPDPNYKPLTAGSIQDGMAYNSTSTDATWGASAQRQLKTSGGTLGSVVITSATAGAIFTIKNATSTIDPASTTLATFTAGALGGTYTFDAAFDRGLIVQMNSAIVASTTITWR